MSLPEQPWGEGRELLQTIWDLAFEAGRWPTFAELDYRWDSRHDNDVAEALRLLPEGFVNGIDLRSLPQGITRIGLTVAGAAACEGAQETLSAFLDFIRVATGFEKGWRPPPDNPEAQPSLTDQEYAGEARGLPAAGRQHLLRLLFLLIHSEPSVWTGTGGPDAEGHWRVTFNRQIRPFRTVTDLDGYWALRYKPWEISPVMSMATLPHEPTEGHAHIELLSAYPQILCDVLLESIRAAAGGDLSAIVGCEIFRLDIDVAVIEEELRHLESLGRVKLHWLDPAPALPHATLTTFGLTHAESAHERWSNRVLRDRAARNALLAWLHDCEGALHGQPSLAGFLRHPRSVVDGHFFSRADLDAAAAYLYQKGLIDGLFTDDALTAAWPTAEGIDCMEQGGNVADYFTHRQGGVTYNFNAPVSGTNLAVGDHATQNATINSVDADGLRTLMRAIIEALPDMNLDAQDQKDAENAAGQVVSEVGKHQPDHPRLRAALRALRDFLDRAGNQVLAAVLSAAIDYERSRLGLPPAS